MLGHGGVRRRSCPADGGDDGRARPRAARLPDVVASTGTASSTARAPSPRGACPTPRLRPLRQARPALLAVRAGGHGRGGGRASSGSPSVALVTHDLGDSVGGEILARSLDGTLVVRGDAARAHERLDLHGPGAAHRRPAAPALAPRRAAAGGRGARRDALAAALRGDVRARRRGRPTTSSRRRRELVVRDGGDRLLPRTIRYIEERRVHEGRWTGAIEAHPSPLTIVWGDARSRSRSGRWRSGSRERGPTRRSVRLDGVGHYPMVEAPERFNAALEHALGVTRSALATLTGARVDPALEGGAALEAGDQRVARRVAGVAHDVPEALRVERGTANRDAAGRGPRCRGSGSPSSPAPSGS